MTIDETQLTLHSGARVRAAVSQNENGARRPRCLLLHGNPGTLDDWKHLMPALAQVADVAAIDMPGFGASSRPTPHFECLSLDRLAEHAVAAANALSWTEPVYLIGHSHGGGVAQVAAARYPDRVAGVVALATLGSPAHRTYRLLSLPGARVVTRAAGWAVRTEALRGVTQLIARTVMKDIFSPEPVAPERVERELQTLAANPGILTSMVDVTLGRPSEQLRKSVANIRCRVLFMHGERDALVPVRCALTLHELIRGAGGRSEMLVLPAAGHMLIEFQASEVVQQIARFLRREAKLSESEIGNRIQP